MRMPEAVNRMFHGNRRQMITAAAAFFIVYILLITGIFSYFHSEDAVSNRLDAKSGAVTIQEPAWDSTGQFKAKASEPGMKIEKDPSGYNNGQVDLFIRLKMTVELGAFDDAQKTDAYKANYSNDANRDSRRLKSVLERLHLNDDTALFTISGTDADWSVTACGNDYFYCDLTNYGTAVKPVYYFYYIGENTDTMAKVEPKTSTKELFNHIDIPIYKKDYLGVFDQPYEIILEAEGIPAANYPNGLTAADAKDEFALT